MRRFTVLSILRCVVALVSVAGGVATAHGDSIFWTELGSINRSALDGSGKQKIFTASSTAGNACGLAIDPVTNQLYWYGRSDPASIDSGYGVVARMNLDGSGLEYVITQGLGTITYGFDIDPVNRRMYIGEHGQMKLANLDGTGLTNLPIQSLYSGEIEVDASGNRLYYTQIGGIRSANLDGSDIQNILAGDISSFSMDYLNSQIYSSEGNWNGGMGIKRTAFGSSDFETLVDGLTLVNSVEIDIHTGNVYWMTNAVIQRANLDGSDIETLIHLGGSGALGKEDMILCLDMETAPPPAVESTDVNGGGVSRSIVSCLVVTFSQFVTIDEGAFEVIQRETGAAVDVAFTAETVDDRTIATLTFGGDLTEYGSLMDGNYQLTIHAATVVNEDLTPLANDYVFGAQEGETFYRFFGDVAKLDRRVNVHDFIVFYAAYGSSFEDDNYRPDLDFEGNGRINIIDFIAFREAYGKDLGFE